MKTFRKETAIKGKLLMAWGLFCYPLLIGNIISFLARIGPSAKIWFAVWGGAFTLLLLGLMWFLMKRQIIHAGMCLVNEAQEVQYYFADSTDMDIKDYRKMSEGLTLCYYDSDQSIHWTSSLIQRLWVG